MSPSDPGPTPAGLVPLDWDSGHFGLPVARLDAPDLDDEGLARALVEASRAGIRLVYWSTRPAREVPEALLGRFGGVLADRRAEYAADRLGDGVPADGGPSACPVVPCPPGVASPGVVRLGVAAGAYSRFRTDPRVPRERFESLYETWIRKCVSGTLADAVLVARPEGSEPIGLVTLAVRDGEGQIGLIAVAPEARGRGVGGALVRSAHREMISRGADRARVVTQRDNREACRLYERHGYRLDSLANVYHFWPPADAGREGPP